MATVLDIGLLSYFKIIFPFLLIYAGVVGVLGWTKMFGENKLLHNIIAITVAFIFVLSGGLIEVINMMVPWITIMFALFIFLVIAYKFLGAKDSDIANVLTRDKTVVVWILIIFLLIMLGSISKIYFSGTGPTPIQGEGGITANQSSVGTTGVGAFWSTLFHPMMLGAIMVLLIGMFAILLLTSNK
jgi:hypothetical protein